MILLSSCRFSVKLRIVCNNINDNYNNNNNNRKGDNHDNNDNNFVIVEFFCWDNSFCDFSSILRLAKLSSCHFDMANVQKIRT